MRIRQCTSTNANPIVYFDQLGKARIGWPEPCSWVDVSRGQRFAVVRTVNALAVDASHRSTRGGSGARRSRIITVNDHTSVESVVVRLPDDGSTSGEVFDLVEQYNTFFADRDVARVALVSSDIRNLAVKSKIDVDHVDITTMKDLEEATEWAWDGD